MPYLNCHPILATWLSSELVYLEWPWRRHFRSGAAAASPSLTKAVLLAVTGRSTNYVGVGVQNKRAAYRFSEMAMTWNVPRASAAEVVSYLERYASEHKLRQHFRLGTEVISVIERAQCGGRRTLVTRDIATDEETEHDVDIVVLAPGITPFIPATPGPESFEGRLVHSSELDEVLVHETVGRGASVVIVGGGKSASECAASLREAGHPASLMQCVASSSSTCAGFEPQMWPRAVQWPFLVLFACAARLDKCTRVSMRWAARLLRCPLYCFGLLVDCPIGGGSLTHSTDR